MVCLPRASGSMAVVGKVRACCVFAVGRCEFGCASTPSSIVACAGYAIVGHFTSTWATSVAVNGTVGGDSACCPSVGDARVSSPELHLG